jgi:hypothetical protein
MQLYSAALANPNSVIFPDNRQLAAVYYVNNNSATWTWNVDNQTWLQAPQYVLTGSGSPTLTPAVSILPSLYVDSVTKIIYVWNTAAQQWQ